MTTRTRRHNLRTLTKTGNVERKTPREVYDWLDREFSFTVDVASTHENALHAKHFTREDNGLAQSWHGERAFMNPPFGKSIGEWVEKARDTARYSLGYIDSLIACVLPARVDAEWWRRSVLSLDHHEAPSIVASRHGVLCMRFRTHRVHLWFFGERVKFDGLKSGAPFPTAVVVFSTPSTPRPRRPADLASITPERPWLTEAWL